MYTSKFFIVGCLLFTGLVTMAQTPAEGDNVDYTLLLKTSDSILAVLPNDCYARFNRSVALRNTAKPEDALQDASFIINTCKDSSTSAWFNRAKVYQKLGQYENAIADYKMAIAAADVAHSKSQGIHRDIAFCYSALHKYQEAVDWYTEAIHRQPNDGTSYYNRGVIYYSELKNTKQACDDFFNASLFGIKQAEDLMEQICN